MPWLIQHKCTPDQAGMSDYAIYRGGPPDMPLTKITCPNPLCREEFFILGHEMFAEAHSSSEQMRRSIAGLPPGFVIAQSRKKA